MNHGSYFMFFYSHSMLLINQLAKHTGIPIHTIRYYERYGLLKGKKKPDVKSNNYTYYDEVVLEKLELIREAKEIGFTLSEIKELIDAWHSQRISVEKKKSILQRKMAEIDNRITQLKAMKKLIEEGIRDVEAGLC